MPSRPHYEVYQTQMLKKLHGFPQFAADPEGNGTLSVTEGVSRIEIGDLGYFREGRFERITGLDIQSICGPELRFNFVSIPMDRPECSGSVNMIELSTGLSITPSALQAIPFGGGPNIRLKCVKGEGAILNVQSSKATYKYCDTTSKMLLGEHMLKYYKQWLTDLRDAWYLEPEQLFLVTGTYMTHNWEAATFHKDVNSSVGFDVTVDAVFLEGKMSIDWETWRNGERGFRHGHTHIGQVYPCHNTAPSFAACCSTCPEPPENQCIFLRGWRVKEPNLVRSRLAYFASVESTEKEELRIKRGSNLFGRSTSANAVTTRSTGDGGKGSQLGDVSSGSDQHLAATLVEAEGTPISTGDADIYDLVAATKLQLQPQEVILLHDDEVIEFFSNSDMDVDPDSKEKQSDLKPAVSDPSNSSLHRSEIEHKPQINQSPELAMSDAFVEKVEEKVEEAQGQWMPPSPSAGSDTSMDEKSFISIPRSSTFDVSSVGIYYPAAMDLASALGSSSKAVVGSQPRERDPHRKEIETRAADKRKSAVKKLQQVLAKRTKGLPESGIANQMGMAAELMEEEDGRVIGQLMHEKKALKKRVDELEETVSNLRAEISALKAGQD